MIYYLPAVLLWRLTNTWNPRGRFWMIEIHYFMNCSFCLRFIDPVKCVFWSRAGKPSRVRIITRRGTADFPLIPSSTLPRSRIAAARFPWFGRRVWSTRVYLHEMVGQMGLFLAVRRLGPKRVPEGRARSSAKLVNIILRWPGRGACTCNNANYGDPKAAITVRTV